MAAKSLVLLGLLAAVSIAASKCQWFEFQCKNGTQCVPAYRRCSGVSDCRDGSDLDGCLEYNAVALPANALVMARVQFAAAHVLIRIHLCGDQHCSSVDLWGVGDDGKLRYETWTGSNRFGWEGNPFKDNKEGSRNFSPGEVVLEAEHRPGRLAVWRQGLPDDVVEVPVEENNGTLRVWPWNWGTDMPVQFLAASKCTWSDFRCKDGNGCVPGYWRCNGNSDCGDGSDEEGCDAHSVLLPANAAVTARVQYVESHELIGLRLCGGHSCSDVWLWGVGDEGTLRYRTFTGCNEFGFNGYLVKDHKEGSRAFPPGELVLEAEHRSGRLAVWRHSRPDDVVEVPVEEDYDDDTLRVRPWNWGTNMTVHFIVAY